MFVISSKISLFLLLQNICSLLKYESIIIRITKNKKHVATELNFFESGDHLK